MCSVFGAGRWGEVIFFVEAMKRTAMNDGNRAAEAVAAHAYDGSGIKLAGE